MAEIRPFCGIRYNQQSVKDLASVICPPYDVVTPQLQETLYQRNDYNVIRLECGQELPGDDAINNRYARAAITLQQWLERDILKADVTPAIYLHDHYFEFEGRRRRKRGIIACVRLEEWNKGVIRPHEETGVEAKVDRLNLLRACRANLSTVYALYDDPEQIIAAALASQEEQEPVIALTVDEGESHRVWAITEPEIINRIASNLAPQPLYIADGHHRYETALAYQRERQAYSSSEASNFIMATLTDSSDPGNIIFPVHRLVRGIPDSTLEGLKDKLEAFFELRSFPFDGSELSPLIDNFLSQKEMQTLGLLGLEKGRLFLLRLRGEDAWRRLVLSYSSTTHRSLGVSILHHIVLEGLLGGDRQYWEREARLAYSLDAIDAARRVLTREYQLLFLLSPLTVNTVKAVADSGEKLLDKSTYFYPKQPTGLVINLLGGRGSAN